MFLTLYLELKRNRKEYGMPGVLWALYIIVLLYSDTEIWISKIIDGILFTIFHLLTQYIIPKADQVFLTRKVNRQ